jgi:hypothetical protein
MKYLLPILLIVTFLGAQAQNPNWKNTASWKIYDMGDIHGLAFSLDTLKGFPSGRLEDDSMHRYMRYASTWPKDKYPFWNGEYIATYRRAGKSYKLDFSVNGGFLRDEYFNALFIIPDPQATYLYNYLIRKLKQVHSK